HKRILAFGWDGTAFGEAGGGGRAAGRFEEPVGLAAGRFGVFVADTWNRRIQRLGPALEPVAEWPFPGWEGRGLLNKPFLAVDEDGRVYASDPEKGRVLVLGPGGEPLA